MSAINRNIESAAFLGRVGYIRGNRASQQRFSSGKMDNRIGPRMIRNHVLALAILTTLAPAISAQERTNPAAPEFRLPSNPAQWINSPPISMEQLRGKAAVLYFFEEQ
jgi:hypothetical protein